MSIDVHAREARAERLWTRRGATLPARFQHSLARASPWAWRARLDLILLFNLASWLIFLALAQIVAPALVARTHDFEPGFAVGVVTTVSALAAVGFAISWAYEVSKSARLRDAARFGHQPGIVLASLVFLSLASWVVAARAAPYDDMLRHPLYGEPIEQAIRDRLGTATEAADAETYAPIPLFSFSERMRYSALVCARPETSVDRRLVERDAFLCAIAVKARRANFWQALDLGEPDKWRAEQSLSEYDHRLHSPDSAFEGLDIFSPKSLGERVVDFAAVTEPWRSRLASMQPWQRSADIVGDPPLIADFAQSKEFRRFIDRAFLFPFSDTFTIEYEIDLDPQDHTRATYAPPVTTLISTPAFTSAFETAERALLTAAPPPPRFTAAEWRHITELRAQAFLNFLPTIGRAQAAPGPTVSTRLIIQFPAPGDDARPALPASLIDDWRRQEADPAKRAAFLASYDYQSWRLTFLAALIEKDVLAAQTRNLPNYPLIAAQWRRALSRPVGPEARLLQDWSSEVVGVGAIAFSTALMAAIFLVLLNQAGLAASLGALAIDGALVLIFFMLPIVVMLSNPGHIAWSLPWQLIGPAVLMLAPLVPVASAFMRGVRSRFTFFFAALSIWTWAIYALLIVSALLRPLFWMHPNAILGNLADLAAAAIIIIVPVRLITTVLATISRFPRAA